MAPVHWRDFCFHPFETAAILAFIARDGRLRRETFYWLWRALVILAAIIVGAGAAAAVFTLFSAEIKVFPLAFTIIAIPSAALGIPTYLAFKSVGRANWKTAAAAGFFVGALIPAVVIFFGPSADQASIGGVPTVINGSYTWAGWTQGLTFVAGFGLLGVIGGLLFYFAVSRSQRQTPAETKAEPLATWRGGVLIAAALCVVLAAFAVSEASKDRSCHNPLRGGGSSIAPVASFDLKVGPDQWRRAERIIHAFGIEQGWDIFSDVRPDDDFKWFQMSLCREPGTEIAVQGYVEFGMVSISVFQPQGGESWRPPFVALLRRIEDTWPKSVAFQGPTGAKINRPNWASTSEQKTSVLSKPTD